MTGYDNELVKSGKIIKEQLEHNNPATLQNFAFNLRRSKFEDRRVRKAIDLAFNFEWANTKLFMGNIAACLVILPTREWRRSVYPKVKKRKFYSAIKISLIQKYSVFHIVQLLILI